MGSKSAHTKAGARSLCLCLDKTTGLHSVVWKIESTDAAFEVRESAPKGLARLLQAKNLASFLDGVEGLCPLDVGFGTGGKSAVGAMDEKEFADYRHERLALIDVDILASEALISPFFSCATVEGQIRASLKPRSRAVDMDRVLSERSLDLLAAPCEGGANDKGAIYFIEPLQEWITARNVLSACARTYVRLRDEGNSCIGLRAGEDGCFARAGFEALSADASDSAVELVAPLCVIPSSKGAGAGAGLMDRSSDALAAINPLLSLAAPGLVLPEGNESMAFAHLVESDCVGVEIRRSHLSHQENADIALSSRGFDVFLTVRANRGERLEDVTLRLFEAVRFSVIAGPGSGREYRSKGLCARSGESSGCAIFPHACVLGDLWDALITHPGYELITCSRCGNTTLVSSRGKRAKYCCASCRNADSRSRNHRNRSRAKNEHA